MTTKKPSPAHTPEDELLDAGSAILVGGGIITMALFPFALPLIALVAAGALALALVGVASVVIVAVVAAPVLLVVHLARAFAGVARETR